MEGKITKATINSMVEYATGTDGDLNSPNSFNNSQASFVPCEGDTFHRIALYLGDYIWTAQGELGTNYEWDGGGGAYPPTTYGTIKFNATLGGYDWEYFDDNSDNGIKTFTFNGSEGYFTYYYNLAAWYTAFYGNMSDIIITLDGSVYKGSVLPENLVVDSLGNMGKAGGGTYVPFYSAMQNDRGDISPEVIALSKHGEHIVL